MFTNLTNEELIRVLGQQAADSKLSENIELLKEIKKRLLDERRKQMNDATLILRLDKQLHDKIFDLAGVEGKNVSSMARTLIAEALTARNIPEVVTVPIIGKIGIASGKSGPAFDKDK